MGSPTSEILSAWAKAAALARVYPSYLASLIKRSVLGADTEATFRSIGAIETIGDCRYAMIVTDFNGTEYRVTEEVLDRKAVSK